MIRVLGEILAFIVVWCMFRYMGEHALQITKPEWWMFWGVVAYFFGSRAPVFTYNVMARIKYRNRQRGTNDV